ncbi:hypothetical protein EMMF5_005527 [Cystobasidiomycetes sp. EMM_F5]
MNVSSIPVNTRSIHSQQPVKWADITKERLDNSHVPATGDMLEDHLEDLVKIPIAQELQSRRNLGRNSSFQSGHHADDNTSSYSHETFPTAGDESVSLPATNPLSESGEASTSQSQLTTLNKTPTKSGIPRTDRDRKRAQSSPLHVLTTSQLQQPTAELSQPMNRDASSSSGSSSGVSGAKRARLGKGASGTTFTASQTPVPGSRKPDSPVVQIQTPRKPSANLSIGGQSSATKSPRQASTPFRGKSPSSSPYIPSAVRLRAKSASTPASPNPNGYYSSHADDVKPPWLANQEDLMYKSDLQAILPSPDSLAGIAMFARSNSSAHHALGSGHPDTSTEAADTSTRSWDDVILPAVAKRIREQQMLAYQDAVLSGSAAASSAMAGTSSTMTNGALTDDSDLVIVDYHADGTPRKFKRVGKKQREKMMQEQCEEGRSPTTPAVDNLGVQIVDENGESHTSTNASEHGQTVRSNSPPLVNENHLSHQAASDNQGIIATETHSGRHRQTSEGTSHTSTNADIRTQSPKAAQSTSTLSTQPGGRPSIGTGTGRSEIWQEPGLHSPNVARANGFASMQRQPSKGHLLPRISEVKNEEKPPDSKAVESAAKRKVVPDGEHKGGCRCIIM